MSSCPGLTPMLHSTIGLTSGSAERSPLHQWKASRGGHPHIKEKTFSKSVNTFDNNHMRCLFFMMTSTNPKMDWCNTLYSNYGHNVTFNFGYTLSQFNDYFATYKVNRPRSNGFLPDVYQIWNEVIWLTPEKGHLVSTAPICWEQTEPSPKVSQQLQ